MHFAAGPRMDILGFEKLLFHADKLDRLKRDVPQFPVHATISLGNVCNHRCRWCTTYAYQQQDARHADADRLVDFLARAAARGLKAVGYVGNGEPTAHPRFAEIVGAVKSLGLEQGMFTNGYRLDRVMDETLAGFTYVRLSLDAGSPAMHAAMHDVPESHFPKIIDNVRDLVRRRDGPFPTIGVQYATHHENIADMAASARLARDIGVDYFSVKPVFNLGAVGFRIDKNRLTDSELDRAVADIRHALEAPGFQVHYKPFQIRAEARDANVLDYDRCVAALFNVSIYEDGRLVGCGPHQVAVGTIDDDLDAVERRMLELSHTLDLTKCPGGCRYHALNHLVASVLDPDRARAYHPNFL